MADETFHIPEQATESPEGVTFAEAPEAVDPAAPYGRLGNGKPRKTPPKNAPKAKAAAAPRPSAARPPKKSAPPDFRPVVEQAAGMLSLILTGMGRRNRAFLADAATVQINAKDGAHVINEMAKINPTIERMLTISAPAVPYVLAGNFLFNIGMQFAANHGKAISVPGVELHDPEQLAQGMERQMKAAADQQAQQERDAAEETVREHAYAAAG